MRAGCVVGRVGGLAVALGVGVAVASSPAVAWAEDGGSPGADSASPSSTAGGGRAAGEDSPGPSTSKGDSGTDAAPTGTGTVADSDTKVASARRAGSLSAYGSGAWGPKGAAVRQVPRGTAMSTGGAHAPATSNNDPSKTGDGAAALPTDNSTLLKPVDVLMARDPEGPAASRAALDGPSEDSDNNRRPTDKPTRAPRIVADTLPAAASRPKLSNPARAVFDVAVHQLAAAPQGATAVTTQTYVSPQAKVVAQAVVASPTEPTSRGGTLSSVVLTALAKAGLGPLAANGPLTPIDSLLGLALAAWGTRPRPSGQQAVEETFAAAAMVTLVNSPPSVPTQPVGEPNAATGVVAGTVIATDPDNDALTFTVDVSDGQTITTVPVSVYVAPIRLQNQASIAVGTTPSAALVSPDGKRLYVANTGSNTVSVIDTATGQKIDANPSNSFSTDISVGSSPGALALSPDGKRLYVANTGSGTVSVINTDTYARIDANPSSIFSTDITVGSSPSALAFGSDGRLYVANRGSNTVSVINTATNTVVDTNLSVSGVQSISVGTSPNALALGPDGRLYVANSGNGTVSVINTSSYAVATTYTVGSQPTGMTLGADGRLYVANAGSGTITVVNTATNTVIDTKPNVSGTQAISVGPSPASVALSPDGALAYVANGNDTLSVVSTKDYTVVGTVAIDTDASGGHVVAVTPNGTVYVTDALDKTVRVLALSATVTPATKLTLLGNGVTITGDVTPRPVITPDGTRAVIVTPVTSGTTRTTRVAVIDTTTGRQVGTTLTLTGGAPSTVLSSDGTRAYVTTTDAATNSIRVTEINTVNGAQIGTTTPPTGSPTNTQPSSADSSRYEVITKDGPTTQTTLVTVVDTTTGTETGTALVTGSVMTLQQLGADGGRVLVTTQSYDSIYDSTTAVTRAVVIDAASGTQLGTTLELTGFPGEVTVSPDGKHALITSRVSLPYDWNVQTTHIAMLDTTTGLQTGTTTTGSGATGATARFSADGTRALLTSYDSVTDKTKVTVVNTSTGVQTAVPITIGGETTDVFVSPDGLRAAIVTTKAVAVVNVLNGSQIGTNQTLIGQSSGSSYFSQFTEDGSRLVLVTPVYNMAGGPSNTRIAVLNMADGTVMGSTILGGGIATGAPLITADGTRALIVTDNNNATVVTVFNTVTGAQVGYPLAIGGRVGYRPVLLSDNGTHAVLAYTTSSRFSSKTQLVVINTLTGAQTASISIPGFISAEPVMTPDGKRLLVTTTTASTLTSRTTRVSVLAIS